VAHRHCSGRSSPGGGRPLAHTRRAAPLARGIRSSVAGIDAESR
jgi:hypothetical protein